MKILTLNTHAWREEASLEKITCLAQAIVENDYDLIALQEVNQMTNSPFIGESSIRENNYMFVLEGEIRRLGGYPYESFWASSKTLKGYYEEGSGILSKFPIKEERVFTVSQIIEPTHVKKRNIIGVAVKIADQWVDVYSCHMGWWHDEIEPFKRQWDCLKTHLRPERLSILMGDFNNNANLRHEGYDYIMEGELWDTYTLAKEKDGGTTVQGAIAGWQENEEQLRIDLILTTRPLEVYTSRVIFNGKHKEIVSDHYGVEVELMITEKE